MKRLALFTAFFTFGFSTFGLFLCLAAPARATVQDSVVAYEQGDYKIAFRELKPFAEEGSALAQFTLGTIYAKGLGRPQDDGQAVKWFRKAAEQGNMEAQSSLGIMYVKGRGVPQDDGQAAKWFRKAAEQENALAQYNLGVLYGQGRGVPQDYVASYMWLSLSEARLPSGDLHDAAAKLRIVAARRMSSRKLLEARRRTREWKPGGP
jgi:hypothetical protein